MDLLLGAGSGMAVRFWAPCTLKGKSPCLFLPQDERVLQGPLLETQMHPTQVTKQCHSHFKAFVTALVFTDLKVK